MISRVKNVLICCLVILLILSNVYYINCSQTTCYRILIGVPAVNEENVVAGTDFSRSTPLENKSQVDTVIFSLLNSNMIQKTAIADSHPDAVIWINDPKESVTYLQVNLWLDNDSIIFSIENADLLEYRIINNTYYASEIKEIIEDQLYYYNQ